MKQRTNKTNVKNKTAYALDAQTTVKYEVKSRTTLKTIEMIFFITKMTIGY